MVPANNQKHACACMIPKLFTSTEKSLIEKVYYCIEWIVLHYLFLEQYLIIFNRKHLKIQVLIDSSNCCLKSKEIEKLSKILFVNKLVRTVWIETSEGMELGKSLEGEYGCKWTVVRKTQVVASLVWSRVTGGGGKNVVWR